MAKVIKETIPTPKYKYILELSEEEAQTIFDITGGIGGPSDGRRGLVDGIRKALFESGLKSPGLGGAFDLTGSIHFS